MSEQEGRPGREPGERRGPGGRGGRGPRRPPQRVEVIDVQRIGTRLVSTRVAGGDLSRFADALPTVHIKVFLPVEGQAEPTVPEFTEQGRVWPEGEPRPTVRTYTPYRYDPATQSLEIIFVLHGEGPASAWADRARIGDRLAIGGPGGRFDLDETAENWWLAGDESALPALAQLLESLPAHAAVEANLETEGDDEILPLSAIVRRSLRVADARPGQSLLTALEVKLASSPAADTRYWIATEATAVRDARQLLLDAGVARELIVTRGYWRRGIADHPDHDYGED